VIGRYREGNAMTFPRRTFLLLAAGAAALPVMPRPAMAQAYPSRPIRLLVGFPPGGSTDILARLMGQWLSERLGQPFVVENRAGAGTNIATEALVNAPPDGYTLLLTTGANFINATLYKNLKFNFVNDAAPVVLRARAFVLQREAFHWKDDPSRDRTFCSWMLWLSETISRM
jgi:tripartite-type tricarboxylate transporter receptor subunit TctC